ncbi:MAG TPA: DUF3330 domain-containing protein [Burkholderiaceae bacterium]|nr:DUF3330 domain-containing protein [Burkholderiaceae bacterium]
MIKREFNPTPPRAAIEDSAVEEAHPATSCEECLRRIPQDARTGRDLEEYVRHFCGDECYEIWRARKPPSDR